MKTIRHAVSMLLVTVSAMIVMLAPITQTGCATKEAVYRTSSTAKVTADVAMRSWGAYVAQYHPPVEQEQKVKSAFEKYQASQLLLLDAAIAYRQAEASGGDKTAAQAKLDAAVAGASSALQSLLGLLQSFGLKFQ